MLQPHVDATGQPLLLDTLDDEVALLPPLGGGADGAPTRPHATIVRSAIQTARIVAEIRRGEDGAVAVFEGIVRNQTRGRKTLYLSAHASHIVGWPVPEGRLLLEDLTEHAIQRQFVYSHKWRVGDLVIWDNRDTMHRGRPHDENAPRDLRRATTLDVGSTLDEAA